MARPRVIVACKNPQVALKMIDALNPRRYRVEHIFDTSEALLRAEIVLAHALVVYTPKASQTLLHQCRTTAARVTTVFVSPDAGCVDLARELQGRYVIDTFDVPDFKRAVYRAVARTEEKRDRARRTPVRDSHARPVQRVLILTTAQLKGNVMGAVLQDQLGVVCEVATTRDDVFRALDLNIDCVVAELEMLMNHPAGADLARQLSRRGISVIPVRQQDVVDAAAAGQVAWDIVPQLRRRLSAREQMDSFGDPTAQLPADRAAG